MASTKERILDTAAELFARYGYTGTGLKQIVAQANAPFGSLYHHFPGGKEQLGEAAILRSGRMYQELVEAVLDAAPDAVSGSEDVFAGAAAVLVETDYADACPIATVALEVASTSEPLRRATAEVFERWIEAGAERFAAAGVPPARARELAISLIAALEGAFVLSRALRSPEPVRILGRTVRAEVQAALLEAEGRAR
jgi:AcrR family transcriptional regulator